MDPNTYSNRSLRPSESRAPLEPPEPVKSLESPELSGPVEPVAVPDELAGLATAIDTLATQDRQGLPAVVRAQRILALRWLADRLEGQWLQQLADLDALGAAGADHGTPAASTASWLRNRLRLG